MLVLKQNLVHFYPNCSVLCKVLNLHQIFSLLPRYSVLHNTRLLSFTQILGAKPRSYIKLLGFTPHTPFYTKYSIYNKYLILCQILDLHKYTVLHQVLGFAPNNSQVLASNTRFYTKYSILQQILDFTPSTRFYTKCSVTQITLI